MDINDLPWITDQWGRKRISVPSDSLFWILYIQNNQSSFVIHYPTVQPDGSLLNNVVSFLFFGLDDQSEEVALVATPNQSANNFTNNLQGSQARLNGNSSLIVLPDKIIDLGISKVHSRKVIPWRMNTSTYGVYQPGRLNEDYPYPYGYNKEGFYCLLSRDSVVFRYVGFGSLDNSSTFSIDYTSSAFYGQRVNLSNFPSSSTSFNSYLAFPAELEPTCKLSPFEKVYPLGSTAVTETVGKWDEVWTGTREQYGFSNGAPNGQVTTTNLPVLNFQDVSSSWEVSEQEYGSSSDGWYNAYFHDFFVGPPNSSYNRWKQLQYRPDENDNYVKGFLEVKSEYTRTRTNERIETNLLIKNANGDVIDTIYNVSSGWSFSCDGDNEECPCCLQLVPLANQIIGKLNV
jgi:hypothetical protein